MTIVGIITLLLGEILALKLYYIINTWQLSGTVIVKGQWMVGCCYWKSVEWLNVESFSLSPVGLLVPYQHSSKSKSINV